VLSPRKGQAASSDANAGSLVGKLVFKGQSVLFCGDTTASAMDAMLASRPDLLASDFLKVPHHGGVVGDARTINDFYFKAAPKVFIISTGRQSHYNKRHMNVIKYSNAKCYDTARNGAILVTFKSAGYSIKPFVP
jgi:competence protein ComEC